MRCRPESARRSRAQRGAALRTPDVQRWNRFGRSSTDSGDAGARTASGYARSASAIIAKALPAVRPFMPRASRPAADVDDPAGDAAAPPSKTRRKHEMHALQDLGEQLVSLDPARLR